jgi:hypothetical protein
MASLLSAGIGGGGRVAYAQQRISKNGAMQGHNQEKCTLLLGFRSIAEASYYRCRISTKHARDLYVRQCNGYKADEAWFGWGRPCPTPTHHLHIPDLTTIITTAYKAIDLTRPQPPLISIDVRRHIAMLRPAPRPQLLLRLAVLVLVLLLAQQRAAAFLLGPRAPLSPLLRPPSNAAAAAGASDSESGSAAGK